MTWHLKTSTLYRIGLVEEPCNAMVVQGIRQQESSAPWTDPWKRNWLTLTYEKMLSQQHTTAFKKCFPNSDWFEIVIYSTSFEEQSAFHWAINWSCSWWFLMLRTIWRCYVILKSQGMILHIPGIAQDVLLSWALNKTKAF